MNSSGGFTLQFSYREIDFAFAKKCFGSGLIGVVELQSQSGIFSLVLSEDCRQMIAQNGGRGGQTEQSAFFSPQSMRHFAQSTKERLGEGKQLAPRRRKRERPPMKQF